MSNQTEPEQALRESIPERSERWMFKPLANGTSGHPEDWGARFEIFSDAGLFIGFCLEEAHAALIARAPEIPELEARISELESDLDTTEGLKSEARGDLEQARIDIAEVERQRDALADALELYKRWAAVDVVRRYCAPRRPSRKVMLKRRARWAAKAPTLTED